MSCTCCSRTSNQNLPAFTSQSVYEGKQHASQSLRETGLCSSVTEEKPSVPLSKAEGTRGGTQVRWQAVALMQWGKTEAPVPSDEQNFTC